MMIIFVIFAGIPFLIFIGVFCFLLKLRSRKSQQRQWLQKNGQAVEATVQSASMTPLNLGSLNQALNNSGPSPFRIIAEWTQPDTEKTYSFTSAPIWIDPQRYVRAGDKIKVTIDPHDPSRYVVDISFLPDLKNN